MAAVTENHSLCATWPAIRWQLLCNMAEQWLAAPSDHWINWTLRVNRLSRCILQYSNRLSDYLFALARYVNYRAGVDEVKSK